MLTRLLDKYSEIEASTQDTKIQNDKLDILTQIVLVDKLLESLKKEDQRLISFFSEESIFTEVERFCFGLVYDFSFSSDFLQRDQNEIRNILSLKCFQVLTNLPPSFYSDMLSSSLEFNIICSKLLLHNIKCNIMKICSEIIKNNIKTTNIDFLDTHFFGFFSQVIIKIMKWNFPIFFMPDIYKQKITEKNAKSDTNSANDIKKIMSDQINIQIDTNNDVTKIIDELNKIIEKLGLYLRLNIVYDQQQSKTFITISEITDISLLNFKYISNLIISNIHYNYAMQEFLIDILKSYPEALPDGTIIKRLSQIACNCFSNINDNTNNKENSSENKNEKSDQLPKSDNESEQFNFDLIFNKLIKSLCNSYDASYTLVDIYRSLPSDSPILYQFLDSYVLNNIIKAASIIFEEGKRSDDSFKHTALTAGLIEIVTKMTINDKLLSSIELPSNLIISEGNVNEVTISFIELYLKKNKSETTETTTSSNKQNIQLNRKQSVSQNSFSTNMANLSMHQPQSYNLTKSNYDGKNIDKSKYVIESKLFKLFFTSEKLQNKLITLFFKNNTSNKVSSNKSLFQSSSTNCISFYDSSGSFSLPSSISPLSSNSFRFSGFDSCPRSSSIGNWPPEKIDLSDEQQSFLISLTKVPGLINGLVSAFDRERKAHLLLTPKSKANDGNNTNSFPIFSLEENGNSGLDSIAVTTSSESSMITSSSYDNLDSTSSADLNAPRWTPACKFLALELVKLTNADVSIPELDSRKWKSGVTQAIRRFNLILDSNYGYGDSLISRHRSCSMNDKLQISQPFSSNQTNSSFNRTGSFNSSTFSMNTSSSQLDSRINSFENFKFSANFLESISEENPYQNYSYENIEDNDLIEPLEVDINNDNFECDDQNKIDDIKTETHKNRPHSLILQDDECFSTLKEKSFSSHAPKSPDFSRHPIPMLSPFKASSNSSSSSDSSSSVCNIKMSTQQTLIQKKKNTKEKKSSPPSKIVSSSNSEGDDEYIIDI